MTLGIFLKIFKLFEQACRRLDYRIVGNYKEDDHLDEIMDDLFFKEGKIVNFQESLAACTDTYLYQLSQFEDETDEEGRKALETTYTQHRDKVEALILTLVSLRLLQINKSKGC